MSLLVLLLVTLIGDSAFVQGSEVFKYDCLPKNGGKYILIISSRLVQLFFFFWKFLFESISHSPCHSRRSQKNLIPDLPLSPLNLFS